MRLLLALLTACAVHFHCLDAAADEAGVWRAASGTLSITYGQAGWRLSDRQIEGALLVIAPNDEPAGPPVCALFAYPEQSLPGQINSQADVNEAIGRLSLARASQGHALVENANGLSISGRVYVEPGGVFRDFVFAVWEAGRPLLYYLSCGAPSEALLRTPRMETITLHIRLN